MSHFSNLKPTAINSCSSSPAYQHLDTNRAESCGNVQECQIQLCASHKACHQSPSPYKKKNQTPVFSKIQPIALPVVQGLILIKFLWATDSICISSCRQELSQESEVGIIITFSEPRLTSDTCSAIS